MQPRTACAGLSILVFTLLALTLMTSPCYQVALLERLAPRIERAQSLTPESRNAILELMQRVRDTAIDPRTQERRDRALQRVTDALYTREFSVNTVGQSPND